MGRTDPLQISFIGHDFHHIQICYGGQATLLPEGRYHLRPRQIMLLPSSPCKVEMQAFAGISTLLERRRLQRTLRILAGVDLPLAQEVPLLLSEGNGHGARPTIILSLLEHIGRVVRENSYLASGLGLDDQIYRSFALCLLSLHQQDDGFTPPRGGSRQWSSSLDDLVDYINSNLDKNLTLTDLEEQSHYSGRHIQILFREKLGCSPMQFIRQQRLQTAMRRLRQGKPGDTVGRVARDCGYRYLSNFTTDFRRTFAVNPSVVLRASRGSNQSNDG